MLIESKGNHKYITLIMMHLNIKTKYEYDHFVFTNK